MKHERSISRILSLLLIVALLFNLAGCVQPPVNTTTTPTTQPTAPSTQPTTEPTEPEPTEPSVPEPTDPPVDPNVLTYTLTQDDVDEFYRLLDECEKLAIAGEDREAIEAISDELDEKFEFIYAQNTIAMILYYERMGNKDRTQQHLDCVEIATAANDAYIQAVRRIYQSGTPARDYLFEDWTEQDIEMLMKYDERIAELQQRNSEIEVEYNASSNDSVRIPLYIEFVQNNNEMAQIYGYDNYYTYAYQMVYDRDYDSKSVEQMRDYCKEYMPQIFDLANMKFNSSYGGLNAKDQAALVAYLYDDYNTLGTDYLTPYLSVMPGALKDHTDHMIQVDSMFTTSSGAMQGAFTTTIGDRSYCFFGRGYKGVSTVVHEAGHYYASRYNDLGEIPLDLAELHSQGNEMLFLVNTGSIMKDTVYAAASSYTMYNNVAMILICLMVDEFEQLVYTTDISGYTAEDFDALMNSVVTQYFELDYVNANLTDVNAYWRQVVVDQPVYYISYAVSVIAAIDLYTLAVKDFASAAEIYRKLCEEPVIDAGFLGNITEAGLSTPFDESFYIELRDYILKGR